MASSGDQPGAATRLTLTRPVAFPAFRSVAPKPGDLARTLAANYSEFPNSCHRVQLRFLEDVVKMLIDRRRGDVGRIARVLESSRSRRALLVEAHDPPPRDLRLPMWQLEEAQIFHARHQVWVHVDFRAYRRAYQLAFPTEALGGLVLDHILNRRVARLKGFGFLRIIPISRGSNSSSGGLSEGWAVAYHSTPEMRKRNLESRASVQYADLADLVKMLDRKTGGGVMDPVNEAQALVRPALTL